MPYLGRIFIVGALAGLLWWLAAGDNFWRGFMAGLLVEELVQLSPWLTSKVIYYSAKWWSRDDAEANAKIVTWQQAIDSYPGRLTKLLGAVLLVVPAGGYRAVPIVAATFRALRRKRRASKNFEALSIVLGGLAVIGGSVGLVVFAALREGSDGGPIGNAAEVNANTFTTAANTLVFLIGALAVIFLIVGGMRYVISQGDPSSIVAAKNTILTAIVGLIVAIVSFASVQLIVASLT